MAVLKELILTVSTFGRGGSPKRTGFYFGGSLERTDFSSFYFARV